MHINMSPTTLVFLIVLVPCLCQRPFYAGLRPIGYPAVESQLEDRFSGQEIPAQLNGDKNYANMLNNLPKENQPFFFINRDKIAESMKNPQTFPQRPSIFNPNTRN